MGFQHRLLWTFRKSTTFLVAKLSLKIAVSRIKQWLFHKLNLPCGKLMVCLVKWKTETKNRKPISCWQLMKTTKWLADSLVFSLQETGLTKWADKQDGMVGTMLSTKCCLISGADVMSNTHLKIPVNKNTWWNSIAQTSNMLKALLSKTHMLKLSFEKTSHLINETKNKFLYKT